MDLSENGKCLFTSLQYVESSHAPYQRSASDFLGMKSLKRENLQEKPIFSIFHMWKVKMDSIEIVFVRPSVS
jgi:hypothetical protein